MGQRSTLSNHSGRSSAVSPYSGHREKSRIMRNPSLRGSSVTQQASSSQSNTSYPIIQRSTMNPEKLQALRIISNWILTSLRSFAESQTSGNPSAFSGNESSLFWNMGGNPYFITLTQGADHNLTLTTGGGSRLGRAIMAPRVPYALTDGSNMSATEAFGGNNPISFTITPQVMSLLQSLASQFAAANQSSLAPNSENQHFVVPSSANLSLSVQNSGTTARQTISGRLTMAQQSNFFALVSVPHGLQMPITTQSTQNQSTSSHGEPKREKREKKISDKIESKPRGKSILEPQGQQRKELFYSEPYNELSQRHESTIDLGDVRRGTITGDPSLSDPTIISQASLFQGDSKRQGEPSLHSESITGGLFDHSVGSSLPQNKDMKLHDDEDEKSGSEEPSSGVSSDDSSKILLPSSSDTEPSMEGVLKRPKQTHKSTPLGRPKAPIFGISDSPMGTAGHKRAMTFAELSAWTPARMRQTGVSFQPSPLRQSNTMISEKQGSKSTPLKANTLRGPVSPLVTQTPFPQTPVNQILTPDAFAARVAAGGTPWGGRNSRTGGQSPLFDRTAHDNFLKKHGMGAGDLIITGSPVRTGFGWIGQSRKQQYIPIPKAQFIAKSSTTGKKRTLKDEGKIISTSISEEFPAVAIMEWNNPASLRSSVAERELEIFKLWEIDVYNTNLPKVTRDRNGAMMELKAQKEHLAHPEETEQYLRLMEERAEEEAAAKREEKREGKGVEVARRSANPIGSPKRGDTDHASLSPITLPSDFYSAGSDSNDFDDDSDVISLLGDGEEKEEQTATSESDRSSTVSEEELTDQVRNAMIDALALEQQQKQTSDQIRASAPTTRNPFVKFARWIRSWFN